MFFGVFFVVFSRFIVCLMVSCVLLMFLNGCSIVVQWFLQGILVK